LYPADRTKLDRRYIAALGGSSLYPRPPFSAAARQQAGAIDGWLDFSSSTVARAVQQWEAAGSEKVLDAYSMLASCLCQPM